MKVVLITFRYVIPGALIGFGLLYVLLDLPDREHAFSLFVGAGVSIMLLNVLHRVGASGESDRYEEQRAREFFSEHGYWPDEERDQEPG